MNEYHIQIQMKRGFFLFGGFLGGGGWSREVKGGMEGRGENINN